MMRPFRFFVAVSLVTLMVGGSFASEPKRESSDLVTPDQDWPWWRGPERNGIANAQQTPPRSWNQSKNVSWMAELPGRGHGSPIVVGDCVIVTTAETDLKLQSVICLDRDSGKRRWKTVVHRNGLPPKSNKKSSDASTTAAFDGVRLYVNFMSHGAVYTTALSMDGEQLWQRKISDYIVHQGYGSSPAIYRDLLIVSADNKGGGAVAALNRRTGEFVWRRERPSLPNYPSPIVLNLYGKDQLLLTGCERVSSFDPLSGKTLWEFEGATTECVTSTVTDGERIFTSGGYPRNHVAAVRADGSGKIEWENTTRVYVPSMLVKDNHLYAVADAGVAICWDSQTGEQRWKHRLGGTFTASPVMVGNLIYATNEAGRTFVYHATPAKFELLAQNQLGDEVFATPTICDGRIFMRVAETQDDRRRERLYCLGKQD